MFRDFIAYVNKNAKGDITASGINEKFFDEYRIFDEIMCERWNYDEDGVGKYLEKMKDSYIEAKDAINEWDTTYQRLTAIKKRFDDLENNETSFDDFQK